MSSITSGRRSTTPKQLQSQIETQHNVRLPEDIDVRPSLPPLVNGPISAILIFHVPKLRWLPKHQSLCRSAGIKCTWWGEVDTSAIFKPQISGTGSNYRQQPSITIKYNIRSELKQFSKYLTDASELVLKVFDMDTNRILGTVKINNLSTLTLKNSIKGNLPIFSNKGEKLGELFVSLRLFLPGTHESHENLTGLSYMSDISNPTSRRNSMEINDDDHQNNLQANTFGQTYTINHRTSNNSAETKSQKHKSNLKYEPPGTKTYKELPTNKVVDELIERANRLRNDLMNSKVETIETKTHKKSQSYESKVKFNSDVNPTKSFDMLIDHVDRSIDPEIIADMIDVKSSLRSTGNLNYSVLTDLEGLENEQSLLDDLLYGGSLDDNHHITNKKTHPSRSMSAHSNLNTKSPAGRSRSPSLSRISGPSNRIRSSSRSRSLTRTSHSDTGSRVSVDMANSDVDFSENESHDDANGDELSAERIQLLKYVQIARIRIDQLCLNSLNDRESSAYASFGRTNKSKRALTYYIEYQFPTTTIDNDGHVNDAVEVTKISSKRFEMNNDIIFSHLSTYSCLFTENNFKNWWRSLLILKIYSRMSGNTNLEQIGFVVLPLRNILKADHLHFEQDLNVVDCKQVNMNKKLPNKVSKNCCIGQLRVMLELDSNERNFQIELDQLKMIEQTESKPKIKSKRKNRLRMMKKTNDTSNHIEKCFPSSKLHELTDDLVVQIYLSITEVRNLAKTSCHDNIPLNPYFVCRAFWNDEPITSVVCWGNATPHFNFEQKVPFLLTRATINKMHRNFVIIEFWDKKISAPSDRIIGIVKIPLEQFYISFKDKEISRALLRTQYPVISVDSWLPIINLFNRTNQSAGEIQVLLAMGTADQITAVQVARNGGNILSPAISTTISNMNQTTSLIEHHFEVMVESINGLRAFESMVWGESDCFVQYQFPVEQEQQTSNSNSIKPYQFRTIRTATTLCTSDPTFHDFNKFKYVLLPTDALHKHFYAACQSTSPIEASIPFEVWSRFYYPNVRDQLLATGKLSAAKLCSMTTMLNSNGEDKSVQSFRIPLDIIPQESKNNYTTTTTTTYGGDLLINVTYRRNIIKNNDLQTNPNYSTNNNSQITFIIDVIRACGLKNAVIVQSRHDNRFNYLSQVGVNTYAKLTLSFLSDLESRSTRTISRTFVPEYNCSINFSLPLLWNNHRNQSISLVEILEHGQLKIDIYHKMNSNIDEKQSIDIHLCHTNISLKELIIRHTGIKGWFPLFHGNSPVQTEMSSNIVGGIELFARFSQQDDRRRLIDSAKRLGWINESCLDEEINFDNQKDLGCLVKLSIDKIQFPTQLLTEFNSDRICIFAQYRFYDKMPIITKRKKATYDRNSITCELKFNKEHLFLFSAPLLWYLREEKLEIQIWTSENDTYDYSHSLASTTDKLIGSIFIDLISFHNKKRNSHRLNSILPIFKQGTKDLSDAYVHVTLTMDTSRNFNELKNEKEFDATNDSELDSYLENRHLNLFKNDRALRSITNNIFSVIINIEQAAHLPNIYSQEKNVHSFPNPYVTYSTAESNHLYCTPVLNATVKPEWSYQQSVKLSIEYLFNEKKLFILKVWHKINIDIETIPEKSGDKVLGFVSIDLSPLLSGLQQISGWYNIMDTVGNIQGQLKISIIPQEDLLQLKLLKYNSKTYQPKLDSHRSNSTKNDASSVFVMNDLSARTNTISESNLNSSMVESDNSKQSFLMTNLRRQLNELDVITERLKNRYNGDSETSLSTNRSTSALSMDTIVSKHKPINLNPNYKDNERNSQENDSFPSTVPFLNDRSFRNSNDLNLTDVLSLHNDHLCLAQELVSKANNLIENSKDFFIQPTIASLSPVQQVNFSTTSEFPLIDNVPPVDRSIGNVTNSFERQYQNDSMIWSADENDDDKYNQSFLPIGVPPLYHQTRRQNSLSPPSFIENATFDEDQQNNIDIVNIRPLNNLSAFNFDCQQMNAERHQVDSTINNNQNKSVRQNSATLYSSNFQPPNSVISISNDLKPVDISNKYRLLTTTK